MRRVASRSSRARCCTRCWRRCSARCCGRSMQVKAAHILLLALALVCVLQAACGGASQAHEPAAAMAAAPKRAERKEAPLPAPDADSDNDGIPDRAELRSYNDRENFRRWFTGIAEAQFYELSKAWNEDQRDCAGLVRFAWREALRTHDRVWLKRVGGAYD